MNISNHILKLSGKAELPAPIEIGHNWNVSLSGSVTKQEDSDNEDGSLTRTYTFKPVKVEVLNPLGETIQAKDTRSNSQLVRALVYKRWVNAASSIDFNTYYDAVSQEIMASLDWIIDQAEKHKRF